MINKAKFLSWRFWRALCAAALALPGGLPANSPHMGIPEAAVAAAAAQAAVAESPLTVQQRESAALLGLTAGFPRADTSYLVGPALPVRPSPVTGLASAADALPQLAIRRHPDEESWRTRLADRLLRLGQNETRVSPQRLAALIGRVKRRDGSVSASLQDSGAYLQEQVLRALIDAGIDELKRAGAGWLRNLELRYQLPMHGRQELIGMNAMFALLDTPGHAIFSQAGLQIQGEEEDAYNFGFGYRNISAEYLLGFNAFYDYLSDPNLQRFSIGLEAKSTMLDLYANWYQAITGQVPISATEAAYTPDGWDVALSGRVPQLPWIDLTAKYYHWDLLGGAEDRKGQSYAVRMRPVPLLSVEAQYDNPERSAADWGVETQLKYRFGVPLREQLRMARVRAHRPSFRRFEQVRREYDQRIFRTRRPGPPLSLVEVDLEASIEASGGLLPVEVSEGQAQEILLELVLRRVPAGAAGLSADNVVLPEIEARFDLLAGSARPGLDFMVTSLVRQANAAEGLQDPESMEVSSARFSVRFPEGVRELRLALNLQVQDDDVFEPQESAQLRLSRGENYLLGASGSGQTVELLSLLDDDGGSAPALPVVRFVDSALSVTEGRFVEVRLVVSPVAGANLQIPLTIGGTALFATDYVVSSGARFIGVFPNLSLTIPANQLTAMTEFHIDDDDLVEGTETIRWTIDAGTGYEVGEPATVLLQVLDNDVPEDERQVAFMEAVSEVSEGVSSTTIGLDVQPPLAEGESLQLDLQTAGSTAEASDYGLTLPVELSGPPPYSIEVRPVGDSIDEMDEVLRLALQSRPAPDPNPYYVGASALHELTIRDDDTLLVGFSRVDAAAAEGETFSGLQVNVVGDTSATLRVPIELLGTADEGTDYTLALATGSSATLEGTGAIRTLVLPPGTSSAGLVLAALPDGAADPGGTIEHAALRLLPGERTSAENSYTLSTANFRLAIRDNQRQVGFSTDRETITEGQFASVLVTLTPAPTVLTTIEVQVTGTAQRDVPGGYTISPAPDAQGIISIDFQPDRSNSSSITIRSIDDEVPGVVRDVALTLQPPTDSDVDFSTFSNYQLLIEDDEVQRAVSFAISNRIVDEGDAARDFPDLIPLSIAPELGADDPQLIIPFTIDASSTAIRGQHYELGARVQETGVGTFSIVVDAADEEGASAPLIPIRILGNTVTSDAPSRTIRFMLQQGGSEFRLGVQTDFTLSIREDDEPMVSFDMDALTVVEDRATPVSLNLVVNPIGSSAINAIIEVGGAAVESTHYSLTGLGGAGAQRTLSVPTGVGRVAFMIAPIDNTIPDPPRELRLTLVDGDGYGLSDSQPTVFTLSITEQAVVDPYVLRFASGDDSAFEGDGDFERQRDFRVSVTPPLPATEFLVVRLQFAGSAELGADYNLPPGASPESPGVYTLNVGGGTILREFTVPVTVLGDNLHEPAEDVELTLLAAGAAGAGYRAEDPRVESHSILDQDVPRISFSRGTDSLSESDTTQLELSVSVDVAPYLNVDVPISIGGRADRGVDYVLGGLTALDSVTFTPTEQEKILTIAVMDDNLVESSEDLRLSIPPTFASSEYVRVPVFSYVLNIEDDDTPTIGRTLRFAQSASSLTESEATQRRSIALEFSPALEAEPLEVRFRAAGTATVGTTCTGAADYAFASSLTGTHPTYTLEVSGSGLTSFDLLVDVCGDSDDEQDERLELSLLPGAGQYSAHQSAAP